MKKKLALILGALLVGWISYWLFAYSKQSVFAKDLFSVECAPPCWRGIYPGVTTGDEAYIIISKFPDRLGASAKVGPYNIFDAYYPFSLVDGVQVVVFTINGVVVKIQFSRADGLITLGEALNEFGVPQYATQSFYRSPSSLFLTPTDHMYFNMLNVDKGIAFGFDTNRKLLPVSSLTESSIITGVTYFDTRQVELLLREGFLIVSTREYVLDDLNVWKGYGDILELYPNNN